MASSNTDNPKNDSPARYLRPGCAHATRIADATA